MPATSSEAGCPFSKGFRVGEPPFSLGKANLEGDRASKSLVLSNYILDPSRFGSEELGIQGGDEGDRVVCARDTQGIDTSHLANQSVLALTKVETLPYVDNFSPLTTINPLGLAVLAEVNSFMEVLSLDNTLNVSKWVKHRIPGFNKMMGLSLGRHEELCIMILQRLETEIEAEVTQHRKDAAFRKAVS